MAVLLGLPAPRRREWLFVALVCNALYRAVLRAAVIDSAEEQAASGLPSGRHGAPVTIVHPTRHRFATSISGLMATPLRIVYVREVLRPSLSLFTARPQLGAREFFLRVLDHHLRVRPQQQAAANDRTLRMRARTESLAAYRLTTRALYHMVKLTPLHTLRAAFFEVLGGDAHCALDLTLRHHRCLVFFAAAHGRIDVLDRLVHRDPGRAVAFDFESGLIPMLRSVEDPGPASTSSSPACALESDLEMEAQLLIARPAALHNRASVLEWLDCTRLALRRRASGSWSRRSAQQSSMLSTLDVGGLLLSLRASGVDENGCRIYGTEGPGHNWRAFRLLVSEAGNGAAIDVLDFLWKQVLGTTPPNQHLLLMSPSHEQDEGMRLAVASGMLLTLLLKPRRGAVLRWIVQRCHADGDRLRGEMHLLAAQPHAFNPSVFDMEDLLHVTMGTNQRVTVCVINALDLLGEERLLRERVVGPGDAEKTDWLLDELAHAEALLAPDAPLPAGLHTYAPATGCGWLARSMVGYTNVNNQPVVGGGFFLRTELSPERWSRIDSLCRHLLRLSYHVTGVNRSSAPLLFETSDTVCTTLSKRIGPLDITELPESFVFASHTSTCNVWSPEQGLLGVTRLQQGLAAVLKRWILHILNRPEALVPDVLHDRFEDWARPLREVPEACYAALASVCERILGAGGDEDWTHARREVLGNLVTHVITFLCDPPFFYNQGAYNTSGCWKGEGNPPRLRCFATCAVAYAELARTWRLVPKGSESEQEIFGRTQTTPDLHAAMRRALMEDTHATGTLPHDTSC